MTQSLACLAPLVKYIFTAFAKNDHQCCSDKSIPFQISGTLKGFDNKEIIEVLAPQLSFEKNKEYILFLVKKDNQYLWVPGNSQRPMATKENIHELKKLLGIPLKSVQGYIESH